MKNILMGVLCSPKTYLEAKRKGVDFVGCKKCCCGIPTIDFVLRYLLENHNIKIKLSFFTDINDDECYSIDVSNRLVHICGYMSDDKIDKSYTANLAVHKALETI